MATIEHTSLSADERTLLERFARELRFDGSNVPEAVWLFGSRARGERRREDSDVDVLVIVADDSWKAKARIHDALQAVARRLGLEPVALSFSVHIHTPAWLARRRQIESFFIAEVDRDRVAA